MKRKFSFISLYVLWSITMIVLALSWYSKAEQSVLVTVSNTAKVAIDKDIAFRTWIASHGGVYVPVTKRTPPNPYLTHLLHQKSFENHGIKYTLMNPSYALSQMMQDYAKMYGIKTHITSKRLLNPKNKPDAWETYALNMTEMTHKEYGEIVTKKGKEYYRLLRPLVTQKSCLKCHAQQGYSVGDVRGAISVSIPINETEKRVMASILWELFGIFVVWIVGIGVIYWFQKQFNYYINKSQITSREYIYGLVKIVEKRDSYTAGHSERVAKYAKMIAQKMGLSQSACERIYRAGMLHDIGKVGIPDSVFLKPSKLTNLEYKLIQEHVVLSYEMLKDIDEFKDILEIVRNHHEHYDGSGYPRGLLGDDISLEASILGVADSFDAMTTNRIYKGRMSVAEALSELSRLSGKQFHPDVIPAALQALRGVELQENAYHALNALEKSVFPIFTEIV